MYSYNKSRSRQNASPKDNFLFGAQFGLQASATPVNERPPKQKEGSKGDLLGAGTLLKGSASSSVDGRSTLSCADGPLMALVPERHNSGSSHHQRSGSRGSSVSSRPSVLPATAFAHDLSNPEPLSIEGDRGSRQSSAVAQNMPVYLPGDRVIFGESQSVPGVPIVYRTPEERSASPDRLNLDRRRLVVCPILEGEDQLRLLNYQHNSISQIEHLDTLKRLIFLDLYDNQIDAISGLSALRSLRVLMLGKNRIKRIENLDNLTKLDVLDLHGNQISKIENLRHLKELRVLNLAGNVLQQVGNLAGMDSLTELNLRRNRIRVVNDIDQMSNLQRLFLSFNDITSFEDISCLGESHSLSELSLDGNPFAQDASYKQTVLRYMQQLRQLDMKTVSEDERRIAAVVARKEEEKKRESSKQQVIKDRRRQTIGNARRHWESFHKELTQQENLTLPLLDMYINTHNHVHERRRLAITNARRQWEVMQGQMMSRTNKIAKNSMPELYANHVATVPNTVLNLEENGEEEESSRSSSSRLSRPTSAKSNLSGDKDWPGVNARPPSATHSARSGSTTTPDKEAKPLIRGPVGGAATQNSDSLTELEADILSLYGPGALEAFDKNWGIQAAGSVTTITFKFIDFDEIAKVLHKIRVRFPNVHTLIFNSTNIRSLHQLNALSAVRRLDNLVLEVDGNPLCTFTLWRTYALFRLAHFCLKRINDIEVSATDIVNAEKFFGTLAHMTTSQLPQSRLLSLLGEKKKQLLLDEKNKKAGEGRLTDRTAESVGRAGLVYTPPDISQQKAQDLDSQAYMKQFKYPRLKPKKDQTRRRAFVSSYMTELAKEAILTNQKQSLVQQMWPQIFSEMVQTAVHEMWDSQAYMKRCLEELERS